MRSPPDGTRRAAAGLVRPSDGPPPTLPRLLRDRATDRGPDALVDLPGFRLGFDEAERRSAELARALLSVGVGPGTHVGTWMPDGEEALLIGLAATRIGAVLVPLGSSCTSAELRGRLRDADVEVLFARGDADGGDREATLLRAVDGLDLASDGEIRCPVAPVLRRVFVEAPSARVHVARGTAALLERAGLVDEEVLLAAEHAVAPSDPITIAFEMGDAGMSVGAVHAHGPRIRHLRALAETAPRAARPARSAGDRDFDPQRFVDAWLGSLAGATPLVSFPDREPSCDDLPGATGAPPKGLDTFVWLDPPPDEPVKGADRSTLRGRPLAGVEAKVVDPGSGAPRARGGMGELWLRSPLLPERYYGREREATFTPDGWLRTGRLCHLEEGGIFRFADRGAAAGATRTEEGSAGAPGPVFGRLLAEHAAELGDRDALVSDEGSISYRELEAESLALASRLAAAGVVKGTRIGLLAPNGIEWATLACAVLRIGATLVPLSTLLKPPELEAQLRTAGVTHLVVAREYRGRRYLEELASLEPTLPTLGAQSGGGPLRHARVPALRAVWPIDALPEERAASSLVRALEGRVCAADPFVILFTSGSRGTPKGAVHTHGSALRAVRSGLAARCVGRGERLYVPMPFFWTGGFAGGLMTALVAGGALLMESDPTPASTVAFLERHRATLFRGWPDQAAKVASDPSFADADLSSLGPGSLAAVLPPAVRPRPGARANLFGMTETFGPYCGSRLDTDMPEEKHGSCGRPFEGVEVRVVGVDDGSPLPPGEKGEIQVRGPNVMRGIVGRLRETTFTLDGYYPTGDLGVVDSDGYLFYHGRRDDMFKVSGATVYPTEVEAALRTIPGVLQAYVTDLSEPAGTLVGAAVVARDPLTVADLHREARARLSAFKIPKRWLLLDSLDELPTMATGKLDKPGLVARLRAEGVGA